jgi:hypothetical protein
VAGEEFAWRESAVRPHNGAMPVSFEGFPRILHRSALRAGRWFVAADGLRPLLCLATDLGEGDERLVVAFGAAEVEKVQVVAIPISALREPFGTVEDEVVFAPGQTEGLPMLTTPLRQPLRHGALLRLANGDLGIAITPKVSERLAAVSLTTGLPADGFDLAFGRWSLALRRGGAETRIGYFKAHHR